MSKDKVLVFEYINEGDTIPIIIEKSNRNFDAIKLFGGGDTGKQGKEGQRGIIGATGIGKQGDPGEAGNKIFFKNTIISDGDLVTDPLISDGDVVIDTKGTYLQVEYNQFEQLVYKTKFAINTAALDLLVTTQKDYDDVSPSKPVNKWILKNDPLGDFESIAVIASKDDSDPSNSVSEFYRLMVGDDRDTSNKNGSLVITNIIPDLDTSAKDSPFAQLTLKYRDNKAFTAIPTNEGTFTFKALNKTESSPLGPDDFYLLMENSSVGFGLKHDSQNSNNSYALVRGKRARFISDLNFDSLYDVNGNINKSANYLDINLTSSDATEVTVKKRLILAPDEFTGSELRSSFEKYTFTSASSTAQSISFDFLLDTVMDFGDNDLNIINLKDLSADMTNMDLVIEEDLNISAKKTTIQGIFSPEGFYDDSWSTLYLNPPANDADDAGQIQVINSTTNILRSGAAPNSYIYVNKIFVPVDSGITYGTKIRLRAGAVPVFIVQNVNKDINFGEKKLKNNRDFGQIAFRYGLVSSKSEIMNSASGLSDADTDTGFVYLKPYQSIEFITTGDPDASGFVPVQEYSNDSLHDSDELFDTRFKTELEIAVEASDGNGVDAYISGGYIMLKKLGNKVRLTGQAYSALDDFTIDGRTCKYLKGIRRVDGVAFPDGVVMQVRHNTSTVASSGDDSLRGLLAVHSYPLSPTDGRISSSGIGRDGQDTAPYPTFLHQGVSKFYSFNGGFYVLDNSSFKLLGKSFNAYSEYGSDINNSALSGYPNADSGSYLSDSYPIQAAIAKLNTVTVRNREVFNQLNITSASRSVLTGVTNASNTNWSNLGGSLNIGGVSYGGQAVLWVSIEFDLQVGPNTQCEFRLLINGSEKIKHRSYTMYADGNGGFNRTRVVLSHIETVYDTSNSIQIQAQRRKISGGNYNIDNAWRFYSRFGKANSNPIPLG